MSNFYQKLCDAIGAASVREREPMSAHTTFRAGGPARYFVIPEGEKELAAVLAADGVHHVLLEGGPTLAAAFLRDGLVDEVVAYVAPVLLGAGATAVGDLGIRSIDEALRLEPIDITTLVRDVRITARPRP